MLKQRGKEQNMAEIEIVKKKNGAHVVVDGNSTATFTKKHEVQPGQPFLAPPGMHTSEEEAKAKGKKVEHREPR